MSLRVKKHQEKDAECINGTVTNRRMRKLLRCDRCPPHRIENGRRKVRDDRYKNHQQ